MHRPQPQGAYAISPGVGSGEPDQHFWVLFEFLWTILCDSPLGKLGGRHTKPGGMKSSTS